MNKVNENKVSFVNYPDKSGAMSYTGCIAFYARITPTEELTPEEIRKQLLDILDKEMFGE